VVTLQFKVKRYRFSTYSAASHIRRLIGLCVTSRAGVQPRPQPKPANTDFWPAAMQPYVTLVCSF